VTGVQWFRRSWMLLALVLVLGAALPPRPSFSAGLPSAPAFNGVAVLKLVMSDSGQHTLDLGAHAMLVSARYGRATDLFPAQLRIAARSPRVWQLQFADAGVRADRRETGRPGLCVVTTVALSAMTGRLLWRSCGVPLPRQFVGLPVPRFAVAGVLGALRCRCAHDPPGPFPFGLSRHAYLATIEYGRIRDVAPPGGSEKWPRQFLAELIWHLAYVDPQAPLNPSQLGGGSPCPETTVDLRASNGTDEGWGCLGDIHSDIASR
jgi:hypothetical protein